MTIVRGGLRHLREHRWLVLAVTGVAFVAILVWLGSVDADLAKAQRASTGDFAKIVKGHVDDLRWAAQIDFGFAIAYVAFTGAVLQFFRAPSRPGRIHTRALTGMILVAGAGLADIAENTRLRAALDDPGGDGLDSTLAWMRGFGVAKWALLGAVAVCLVLLSIEALAGRIRYVQGPATARPPDAKDWDPPSGRKPRLGVCLSGGGIRSASFSLGVLQALDRKGVLKRARYLSAVSGGGYLAAGWAVSAAPAAPPPGPRPWSPGSPEERSFRDHSSYLVPDVQQGAFGAARLLAGIAVNLTLLWLLLFAIARPVGWTIYAQHEELRAREPVALLRDGVADVQVESVTGPVATVDVVEDGQQLVGRQYEVRLRAPGKSVCFDREPFEPGDHDVCFRIRPLDRQPGIVQVSAGRAEIARNPMVEISGSRCAESPKSDDCKIEQGLFIDRQPVLTVRNEVVIDQPDVSERQVRVEHQPTVRSKSGLVGRDAPRFAGWMWAASVLLVAASVMAAAILTLGRLRGRAADGLRHAATAFGLAGLACFAVTIALPWIVFELPDALPRLFGSGDELTNGTAAGYDYLVPTGGFVTLALAALRQYFAANRTSPAANEKAAQTSWPKRIWKMLVGSKNKLEWYALSPIKVVAGIVLVLVPIAMFLMLLQYAVANGPNGTLMGFAVVRDSLPTWMWWPEWLKLAVVVAVLVLFAVAVDAHSWSLHPFYKRRLSSAYLLQRQPDGGVTPYADEPTFTPLATDDTDWPGLPAARPGTPELITCCAVNLSEPGRVPPGRRATSFTFSREHIGGPLVGWAPAEDYWARLSTARRKDVTVPSAMSISGAAFSPAMGKFNFGPVGGILAMANLRLGVWLPHPQRVNEIPPHGRWWWALHRPHWTRFLREVTNRYPFRSRYLYVSDGGHWDNLGLVELLRRGCTRIVCVNAGGDNQESFSTISEAIALAREELGVEITLDPSPLRPPLPADGGAGARQLRRAGAKDKVEPMAAQSFVQGTFRFPGRPVVGKIWLIEPALTPDLPFDVHGFAESEAIFPDDGTGDQVYSHRQFESFRRLGQHQAEQLPNTIGAT
ncbi:MAG: patatin-like phospholipase family protein [Actinomycetota bacterium]